MRGRTNRLQRNADASFHRSLIEQSRARRHEKTVEGATGIRPGNRGKDGRNWCGRPLRGASRRQAYVTSSSGRCRNRSSSATKELCGEARSKKPRSSRVRSMASFGPCTDAVTQRVTAATARPERSALFGRGKNPPKGPADAIGGARKEQGAAWSGAGWQQPASLPRWGGPANRDHPTASRTQPER